MGDAAQKEPSMEDILSSIRKIVAQEDKADAGEASGRKDPGRQSSADVAGRRLSDMKSGGGERSNGGSLASLAEQVRNRAPERSQTAQAGLASASANEQRPQPSVPSKSPEVHGEAGENSQMHSGDGVPAMPAKHGGVSEKMADHQATAAVREAVENEIEAMTESAPKGDARSDTKPAKKDEEADFREALLSPSTEKAVSGSFDKMKKSVLENIEGRMDALMRPMLAEWLDEHLPEIVERVVREEIQRLSNTD